MEEEENRRLGRAGDGGNGARGGAGGGAGRGIEELRAAYPEVKLYDPHGRVLTVWGTPMTAGETLREAAEEWVFWYGEVFGDLLDLEEFREATLRYAPEGAERRVFMYRQTMEVDGRPEPLTVVGSSFRVMTEGAPEGGAARVVYVAGRVATRPVSGLPEPTVTPAQAVAAAKAHERGRELDVWGEPELVAIYDDAPVGDGVAQAVWRVSGASGGGWNSWSFYIDAVTGAMVRDHSNLMNFTGDVQGTVTGYATPGTQPDTFDATSEGCPNDAQEFDLPDVWVAAYEEATMETLVAAASTDEFGDYTLDFPTTATVHVFAELKGPSWFVLDGATPCGVAISPLPHAGNPVTSPATGVDMQFNPTPTEKETAMVNAHRAMSATSRWLDLSENAVPDVPISVHESSSCFAAFASPGLVLCSQWQDGSILFSRSSSSCANTAYSTVVAHEYGHFVAWHLAIVQIQSAFNEGLGDALAALVFDTEFLGEDFFGCDDHFRWPRQPSIAAQQVYPKCEPGPTDPPVCSMGRDFDIHCSGELLPAIWRDLHDEFGDVDTRTLFLDWMMIAQSPAAFSCPLGTTSQGAGPNTLVEVLQVAGNQKAPAICNIFENVRNIAHPGPSPTPCEESAGWACYGDCDDSGSLDFFDFLCFQNAFVAGSLYADCDSDDEFTFFDFLCFQAAFAEGCP